MRFSNQNSNYVYGVRQSQKKKGKSNNAFKQSKQKLKLTEANHHYFIKNLQDLYLAKEKHVLMVNNINNSKWATEVHTTKSLDHRALKTIKIIQNNQ